MSKSLINVEIENYVFKVITWVLYQKKTTSCLLSQTNYVGFISDFIYIYIFIDLLISDYIDLLYENLFQKSFQSNC